MRKIMASAGRVTQELIGFLLEHHRFYINRNWQYFGAILLIDSLVLNAYGELNSNSPLVVAISSTSVLLVAIFYHLINWTDMRIDRNAYRLNALDFGELIESPKGRLEGLILWMKLGVVVAAAPHFWLAGQVCGWLTALQILVAALLVGTSERIVASARRRPVEGINAPAA